MQHAIFKNRIALRIDVDYPGLYPEAVGNMLALLDRTGAKATFFVATGTHEHNLSLSDLMCPSYIRRLLRLKAWRAIPRLFSEPERADEVVKRVVESGHEVAVHGFKHRWWMENIQRASETEIQTDIDMAYESLATIAGSATFAWGSPGWRTTGTVLRLLAQRAVPYFSECWGFDPFVTACEGRVYSHIPHLPITLPSLESLLLTQGSGVGEAVERILNRPSDRYDMFVAHDYFEGGLRLDAFAYFLLQCAENQMELVSVGDVASAIVESHVELPTCHLSEKAIPGFVGQASFQGDPL